jgi:hypothetical protein
VCTQPEEFSFFIRLALVLKSPLLQARSSVG